MNRPAGFRLYAALFLSSLATLGFEVLLTRIFSIALWYHFGHMVVSIAMLGLGLSGTFWALRRRPSGNGIPNPRPELFMLLAMSMVGAYLLAVRIPFDPVRLSWDRGQLWLVGLYYVTLSVPFFFAGLILVTAFSAPGSRSGFVYGSDLLGAATGCLVVFWLLWKVTPGEAALLFALFPLVSAGLLGSRSLRRVAVAAGLLLFGLLLLRPDWVQTPLSPYKELPTLLQFQGAGTLRTQNSPYGRIDLFRSPGVRYAPGLSLAYNGPLPDQLGLAVDGGSVTAVTPVTSTTRLDFLKDIPASAAYGLRTTPEVFVDNPGGGLPILVAEIHGASRVDTVEQNPAIAQILSGTSSLNGLLYPPGSLTGLGRNYVNRLNRHYDIVDLSLTSDVSSLATGTGESYAYTVEAFQSYLRSLKPDGILSVSTFILPPFRTELRVLNTLLTALESGGLPDSEKHIFMLRSLEVLLILVKRTPFEQQEINKVKDFARKRWFDVVHYPGIEDKEKRRFIKSEMTDLTAAATALLNPETRLEFSKGYVFDISAVTDDRPFFYEHLRWARISDTYALVQKKWDFFIREGYLTLAVLVQILAFGLPLIAVPAVFSVRRKQGQNARPLVFFACLGFGYMAVEVPLIQKMTGPLEHPFTAFAATVGILLVASGMGSLFGQRLEPDRYLGKVLVLLGTPVIPLYVFLLPEFNRLLSGIHSFWKIPMLGLFLFPVGFLMGMPFPAGIAMTATRFPALIPWAWAINGFLSVTTPILSVVMAWKTGLRNVMLMGAAAYLMAYFAARGFWTSPTMGTKTTGVV